MLGAFVSGMFEGAKSTFELMEARNKMEVQNRKMQEGRDAEALLKKDAEYTTINASPTFGGGGSAEPAATTGTSTPPAPKVEPTPVLRGGDRGSNPGDPELWDQIKPYIQKYEGANSYKTGYGLGEKGDITKYPAKPGYFGFPDWPGADGPQGKTHAGGMYQFQPDTWKYYAEREGVNDFSPESQDRVARRAYLEDGLRHWVPFNETLRTELAKAGLLGGLATRDARTGQAKPPTARETSADIGGGLAAPAPDLEGQRDASKFSGVGPLKPSSAATSPVVEQIVKPVVSALTPAPQQMPDGSAQFTPNPVSPPTPNPIAPTRSAMPSPADQAAAQSALTPVAPPAVAAAPVVATPSPRNKMTQRQQYDADIAEGRRPTFPPTQRFNSRGEAVSAALYGPQAPRPPSQGDVSKGFAAANKVIRLPDGTLVDGAGSVVQQPQSALFSR